MTQITISEIGENQLQKLTDLIDTLFHTDILATSLQDDKYNLVIRGSIHELREVVSLWDELKC